MTSTEYMIELAKLKAKELYNTFHQMVEIDTTDGDGIIKKNMENNKQSCVEWLKRSLEDYGDPGNLVITWEDFDKLIEKTKEMHKEELISFFIEGCRQTYGYDEPDNDRGDAEHYYNQTYNK